MKRALASFVAFTIAFSPCGLAAQGEMGRGVPSFAVYGEVTGAHIRVWSVDNALVQFPAGCTALILTPATLGVDTYRAAIAILTAAKLTNTRVRFYAHAERDGGCGVDYIQPDG
jgi:hypothetical protein